MITSVWTLFKISRQKLILQIVSNHNPHATDVWHAATRGSFSATATHPPASSPSLERSMTISPFGWKLILQASHKTFLLWGSEGSSEQESPLFSLVSEITYSSGTRWRQFPVALLAHGSSHPGCLHTVTEGDFSPLAGAPVKHKDYAIANISFPQFLSYF